MSDKAVVESLAWDSAWLGYPVGRVGAQSPRQVAEAVADSQARGLRLLYLVIDSAAEAAIAGAQAAGAWLADVRLTYHKPLPEAILSDQAPQASGIEYQLMTEPSAALDQLALQSSQYSRFRRDARISVQACNLLYAEWLRQALAGGGAWVAVRKGTTLGLLTLGTRNAHASIELLAVSAEARHQGLGQGLVQVAQREASRQGQALLQVVTQETNRAAQLFYEHCGFQLARREHVFHLWQQPE
ncbi:GNAT family N-acetyltransferase [Hymenobacter properus]|uniref:GNAT family N-acetyltransferase n=1 Tax=Hymenobacter properus TaxID=2791026 RepID=A0A931FJY1_9BACT|nr:GNAT family N-acetyltransferase [Hymenobacter properus]MBF9143427.1 GNAT family N-acetyltransferase [Hymenobacter properus]MBR7722240.1 GNAT family N-acetyltransferase [Microvirga sp. SRT04]